MRKATTPTAILVCGASALTTADNAVAEEWQTKTIEKMQAENGNRAEYRTVMSTSLLQGPEFRD